MGLQVVWLAAAVIGIGIISVALFMAVVETFPPVTKTRDRALLRCECRALYWSDDQEAAIKHVGHQARYATEGTHWEMFKVKVGLI